MSALARERERSFRDFGQAVWEKIQSGKFVPPEELAQAAKRLELSERKWEAQAANIRALLAEGEVAASSRKAEKAPAKKPHSTVAARGKKR